MEFDKQTLLRYLCKKNPKLTLMDCSSKSNTPTKPDLGWGWPAEIQDWSFFEYENLKKECEHLLQQEFYFPYLQTPSALPFLEIHDEGSLEVVLIKWNHSRVSEALAQTQELERDGLRGNIYMVKGGQAELVPARKTIKKKKAKPSRPDWGGIKRLNVFDKGRKYWNILPGETKLSQKWHSRFITVGKVWPEFGHRYEDQQTTRSSQYDQLWLPLRQIFSYCTRLNRKYGYIITDQELVVIKVNPESQYNLDDKRTAGLIQYKSIPWETDDDLHENGEPRLTVNLALWWLYTMASKDERLQWPHEPFEPNSQEGASSVTPQSIGEESTLVSDTPIQSFRSASTTTPLRRDLERTELDESDTESDEHQNHVARSNASKRKKSGRSEEPFESQRRERKGVRRR